MLDKIKVFSKHVNVYLQLIVSIVYGLFVVFCLTGSLIGKGYLPVVGIVVVCLTWTMVKIIHEALAAFKILMLLINGEKLSDDQDHNDHN